MTTIAQLSDCHVKAAAGPAPFGVEPNAALARAVAAVVQLDPRPDALIMTGDLVNHGAADEYLALKSLLEPVDVPLFLVPGNHDDRTLLPATFDTHDYFPRDGGRLNYAVEDFLLRLVAIDTSMAGRHDGEVGEATLAWLDRTLAERPETPTLVMMHHPPFRTGIWWMDAIGLTAGREGLAAVLAKHAQVQRVVCGHIHRSIQSSIAGIPVTVCPSTCHAVHLDRYPEREPHFIAEPPAMLLHCFSDGALVTHTCLFAAEANPINLVPDYIPNWEERKRAALEGLTTPNVVAY